MLILDSDSIEPGDRDDALEAAFNSSEVPQRVRYVVPPGSVRHRIELFDLGPGAHLLRNAGTGIQVVRGPKEVRSGAPDQLTNLDPGKMTIAAIAHGNGFASASHFTKRFRQGCGTTPREWRRLSREGR